jgi:PEP-CTERM motif
MRTCVYVVSRVVFVALMATAPAQAIPFNLTVTADGVQIGDVDETDLGCVDTVPGEAATCLATGLEYGPSYTALTIENLNFQIENDPQVNGSMTVFNNQNFTQHFTLIFTLPVSPISAPTDTSGSYRATVRDGLIENNGATLATQDPGDLGDPGYGALYTALIDGNDWQDLYLHPQSFSSTGTGTNNVPLVTFGSPVPIPGPAVNTSIGIRLDFTLSGLDRATFTSNHLVTPEPHTGALMALGLAALAKRRRH